MNGPLLLCRRLNEREKCGMIKETKGMNGMTFETERLVLRRWKASDIDDYFEFVSDPEVRLAANSKLCTDESSAELCLRKDIENPECYAITLKDSGKAIGYIKFQKDITRPLPTSRSVGYELNRAYWGKGYMPEALEAMLCKGFEEMQLEVIAVGHFDGNDKSKSVIEKCGFTYEGITRKLLRKADGTLVDAYNYSITKEEYLSRNKR